MGQQRIEQGANAVVVQRWLEYEWGSRPDGFSLHLSLEGLKRFYKEVVKKDETFEQFWRPLEEPYRSLVSDSIIREIQDSGQEGVWYPQTFEVPERCLI